MPNRTIPPKIHEISQLTLPAFREYRLDNGIPVYLIEMGTQEVLKLEVIFHAGRPYEHKKLISRATGGLLKEGSHLFNSAQIAEQIDFYGATLNVPINLDTSSLVLYTLSRHLEALLPLLQDILTRPAFPEKELKTFVDNSIQTLQVELSKSDVVAYRTITELFFGSDHPYGYNSSPDLYQGLHRDDLQQHFNQHFHAGNCKIILSGRLRADTLPLLNKYLGKAIPAGKRSQPVIPAVNSLPEQLHLHRPDSLQTAIRIGRRFPRKGHPDYQAFFILNTLFGGYFGSRLMANIREDKGYTYNVFSTLDALHYDSCFYLGTEVGNEFVEPTLLEIYREMDLLSMELASPKELEILRNFLLGNLLSMIDGAFNVASIIKAIVVEELDPGNFDDLVHLVKTISAEDLRDLAQKYLQRDAMWEVIVGAVKSTT